MRIYIQYIEDLLPCSIFFYLKCGGGLGRGGGMFFLHCMLFPTFLEKQNSGKTKTKFVEKQLFFI